MDVRAGGRWAENVHAALYMRELASLGYDAQWPKHECACEKAMRYRHASLLHRIRVRPTAWRTLSDQHATTITMLLWTWSVEGGCNGEKTFDGTIIQETWDIG